MISSTVPERHGLAYCCKQISICTVMVGLFSLLVFPVVFGMACFDLGRFTLACWFNRVDLRSWHPAIAYTLFVMVGASVFAFILTVSYAIIVLLPEALSKLF